MKYYNLRRNGITEVLKTIATTPGILLKHKQSLDLLMYREKDINFTSFTFVLAG
jgi:hypothetical protein